MQIIQLIVLVLTFASKIFDLWREKDKERAKKLRQELTNGLKAAEKSDRSGVTAFFDNVNRL